MTRYETSVLFCRKSDRERITANINLPRWAVIDMFCKAKLGDGIMPIGDWNVNLDEYLFMGIINEKMWV